MRRDRKRLFRLPIRRRSASERDVEEEILLHLALRAEQLCAQGMSSTAARDEAIRRFGPLNESRVALMDAARHREEHLMRAEYLQDLKQDVTFALRTLRRQPGWTAVAVLTLALGIAATTAVWSAASTLLLHPLAYPNADRVVMVGLQATQGGRAGVNVSISPTTTQARLWRDNARSFEAFEPYAGASLTVSDGGEGTAVTGARVLPSFFDLAGARPVIGPGITAQDISTRAPVIGISEVIWQTRFASAARIIGKTLIVDGAPRRIVGVYPAGIQTPVIARRPPDIWVPLDLTDQRQGVRMVGRLRPGITAEAAKHEIDQIMARDRGSAQNSLPFETVVTTPARTIDFRSSLIVLTGAVGLVLLVACANVAHLLLARTVSRRRELGIRAALGAARSRIVRLLLTESIVLAVVGAALGIGGGYFGLKAIVALRPSSLSELRLAHVDGFAMSMIVVAASLSGLFFGVISALNPSGRAGSALAVGSLSDSSPRRNERLRAALVVSEMAMSGLLLVGAVLLIRTVAHLQHTDLGFDPKHLSSVDLDLPDARFPSPESRQAAISMVEQRLLRSPHVKGVTVSNVAPNARSFSVGALEVEGEPRPPATTSAFIDLDGVAADYFRLVGARLVAGRTFEDTSRTSHEVILNASYAQRHWPAASAVGKRVRISFNGSQPDWNTVVGVVDDIAAGGPVADRGEPVLYVPRGDHHTPALLVRTDGDPAVLPQLLQAVRLLKPQVVPTVTAAEDVVASSIAAPRFIMTLLAAFTALALLLASIGLYGVMAYSVAQRTREIGIRIALGATPKEIGTTVLVRGTVLAVIGASVGLLLAFWGTRVLEGSLYGVSRLDPVSFAVGGVLLLVAAIIACVVPIRRAVRVDPIEAIRVG